MRDTRIQTNSAASTGVEFMVTITYEVRITFSELTLDFVLKKTHLHCTYRITENAETFNHH